MPTDENDPDTDIDGDADTDSESDGGAPACATRDRPVTEDSYGIPDDGDLLPWSFVADRVAADRTFWISTTRPDGRPHARPVWGVWLDDTFHCGGGPNTRWVRNLDADPRAVVHRESGDEVVILDGVAEKLTADDADRLERVDDAYEEKYGVRHGAPAFAVRPEVVLAWRDFPADATRWTFEG